MDAKVKQLMVVFWVPIIIIIIGLIALCVQGCATTQTPEMLAGKSMLTVKEVIITSAIAVDGICDQKLVPADKCATAKLVYEQSKPAYDLAVESLSTVILMNGAPDAWDKFAIANQQLMKLYMESLRLAIELGVVEGGVK